MSDVLNRKIEDVDWCDYRVANCLRNLGSEGIHTIGDLVKLCPAELLRTPNMGTVSVVSVIERLRELGVTLADTHPLKCRSCGEEIFLSDDPIVKVGNGSIIFVHRDGCSLPDGPPISTRLRKIKSQWAGLSAKDREAFHQHVADEAAALARLPTR